MFFREFILTTILSQARVFIAFKYDKKDRIHISNQRANASCIRIDPSRKFWSGENFGPGDQNSRKIGPPGPLFPENLGPAVE